MTTLREALLDEVAWCGALPDRSAAAEAFEITVEALARNLVPADREVLAERLPGAVARLFSARSGPPVPETPEQLYARLASRARVSAGTAAERARVVCQVLAARLAPPQVALLRQRLPPEWASLLEIVETASPSQGGGTRPGHGHTLATGKPGSGHPIAEGRPPGPQAESVAASPNPHGETKVSSGHPSGGETLASGQPGGDAPIADAKDERPRGR